MTITASIDRVTLLDAVRTGLQDTLHTLREERRYFGRAMYGKRYGFLGLRRYTHAQVEEAWPSDHAPDAEAFLWFSEVFRFVSIAAQRAQARRDRLEYLLQLVEIEDLKDIQLTEGYLKLLRPYLLTSKT
jgi:hypothetical protein